LADFKALIEVIRFKVKEESDQTLAKRARLLAAKSLLLLRTLSPALRKRVRYVAGGIGDVAYWLVLLFGCGWLTYSGFWVVRVWPVGPWAPKC
jgi:hypothetical protein